MTAEIAVMNKLAVALAADSTVTSPSGKVYDTVDKLFQLDNAAPVAVMIYGGAEFMGIPWESVIKLFRKLHSGPRDRVRDYADAFLEFLVSDELLDDEIIDHHFFVNFHRLVAHVLGESSDGPSVDAAVRLENAKAETVRLLNAWEGRRYSRGMNESTFDGIIQRYEGKAELYVKEMFPEIADNNVWKDCVRLMALRLTTEVASEIGEYGSGIVFAGFGEKERFPAVVVHTIECAIYPRILRSTESPYDQISINNNASIIPFAQAEMVHTFMKGVDPVYVTTMSRALKEILDRFSSLAAEIAPISKEDQRGNFLTQLNQLTAELVQQFKEATEVHSTMNHVQPIIQAVAMLPKDQLAMMAESLVSLTSFRRKMSSNDIETVGGPIDVAVVSKGDGFVWIKRKHYFDASLNLRYIERLREDRYQP